MAKIQETSSKKTKRSYTGVLTAEKLSFPSENLPYKNYLGLIHAFFNNLDYEEPEIIRALHTRKNRPKGFMNKSIVIRIVFDYLLMTIAKHRGIDLTDLYDEMIMNFIANVPREELEPLSERSFSSLTKKNTSLKNLFPSK